MEKLHHLLFAIILFVILRQSVCGVVSNLVSRENETKEWYETASFYQIYPRSFKDSNGDGIGDLNGITEKLEYLKEIGITATWLSPIFKSPMADFGYDISDFYDIQPEYGTLADFDRLVEKAKSLDIKIILDLVPNHSSDENEWFIKSENKEPGFEDFYIWHPGYPDPKNASNRLPPNNWLSVFRGKAWTFSEKRQEFYYHQFLKKQPDLNYRNPKVVEEMKNVMNFWLKRGIAGFRVDAVSHMFEVGQDAEGKIPDEPKSGATDPDDFSYLIHIYTLNMPETIDMVYQFRTVLDDFQRENGGESKVMMTEIWGAPDTAVKYYGNATHEGAQIPFNFQLFDLEYTSRAKDYVNTFDSWIERVPKNHVSNWVIGNHDRPRVASRMGTLIIDAMNMIVLQLPGIAITYNGEEIGMQDQWLSWSQTVDPAACNTNPDIYENFSRDPERTPFQWNNQKNGGFSTALSTWLPVADNYQRVNVEKEEKDQISHLKVYKRLQELRREKTIQYGATKYTALNKNVFAIVRYLDGEKMYITLVNTGIFYQNVNLNLLPIKLPKSLVYHIVDVNSKHHVNKRVFSKRFFVLRPFEALILRSKVGITQ